MNANEDKIKKRINFSVDFVFPFDAKKKEPLDGVPLPIIHW